MSADLLQRLLDGRLTDPDGGTVPAVATRLVAIERSLRGDEAALLGQLDLGGDLAVVADPTTWRVLGAQVAQALGARRATSSVILPEHPHADDATVHHIRVQTAAAAALVAVFRAAGEHVSGPGTWCVRWRVAHRWAVLPGAGTADGPPEQRTVTAHWGFHLQNPPDGCSCEVGEFARTAAGLEGGRYSALRALLGGGCRLAAAPF